MACDKDGREGAPPPVGIARRAVARLGVWRREAPEVLAHLRTEVHALYLAWRDPRVPWWAKAFAACVAAYALSPIDLIPDFIPVLGYLDDLVIVPLGIWLAVKMIPAPVLRECREKARARPPGKSGLRVVGAAIIVSVWLVFVAGGVWFVLQLF